MNRDDFLGEYPIGWQADREAWHFCRRLYHKYRISLGYGEYSTIVKTIERGFGMRVPRYKKTTVILIPFRHIQLPVIVKLPNCKLISVMGPNEFLSCLRRHLATSKIREGQMADSDFFTTLVTQLETVLPETARADGFNATAWVAHWINEPVPALGGARPIDLMTTTEGQVLVSRTLAQIWSGAYS